MSSEVEVLEDPTVCGLFTRKLLPARTRAERNERGGGLRCVPLVRTLESFAAREPLQPAQGWRVADTMGTGGKEERGSGKRSALSSAGLAPQASGTSGKRRK